ncbi:dihydrofolate reductase family protein [Streptomyces tendae]|uniref:dihydrofolate reductase family protein n=1 Tax=Streptomyces tendae TaxID=1932 RepID=UPI0036A6351F
MAGGRGGRRRRGRGRRRPGRGGHRTHPRGLRRIDCEGGTHLFGALTAVGLVDELRPTVSPLLTAGPAGRIATGPGPPTPPTSLRLATALAEYDILLLRCLTPSR